ncbi:hypothetical protein MTR_2g023410 [Medicago truncatula]|uniref:RNase H type-1 domain-containing protein n=1 Tax=Medicago truncatula TaxID=3880 RepID=A0A072V6C5_MEDTR|nr:hypothetical protein MTR_2g023410 [Medicago truncatula]
MTIDDCTFKLNIDDSFLEGFGCLGAGGVVRNHDGDWIAGFSHYEVGGDALLAELRVIQIVDLITAGCDHTLHTYVTDVLHIRDALHENGNTQQWFMFLGNKICMQILWLRKNHMQDAMLTGIALRLIWNVSS